jgi:hypothetical protein
MESGSADGRPDATLQYPCATAHFVTVTYCGWGDEREGWVVDRGLSGRPLGIRSRFFN